jgi:hypothetical protein
MKRLLCNCFNTKLSRTVPNNFRYAGNIASFNTEKKSEYFSKMLVSTYESTRRHNPEEERCHVHCRENLKFLFSVDQQEIVWIELLTRKHIYVYRFPHVWPSYAVVSSSC